MTHELRLVDGDVLDADTALVAANLDDPVYQQERVAMREQIHDLLDVRRPQLSLCHASNSPPSRCTRHLIPARASRRLSRERAGMQGFLGYAAPGTSRGRASPAFRPSGIPGGRRC